MREQKENEIIKKRLECLRAEMEKKNLDAYLIPTGDYHGSEYVGDFFKARAYMSGFTGSAGTLLVLKDRAMLWTDGRYFIQAKEQLKGTGITLMRSGEPDVPKLEDFLKKALWKDARLGFDGRTICYTMVEALKGALTELSLQYCGDDDLVGNMWCDRPEMSAESVWELQVAYAGCTREEKLMRVRKCMKKKKVDVLLLTALDDIAWLLNLRGNDILYTPVFLSYMVIKQQKAVLYVKETILSKEIREELESTGIEIDLYENVDMFVNYVSPEETIWIDKETVNYHLVNCIKSGTKVICENGPICLMKACKNACEVEHIKNAHIKDGVAMTRFIRWLKEHVTSEQITEISAAEKLLEFRAQMDGFIEQSFDPIIAYGAHGAIVHYSATEASNVLLNPKGLCLMDTGGHYLEGTTDITRTIALGNVTEEERIHFTRVLKGNLNLGAAVFKKGMCGQNLDYLARKPLWEVGLDYNHGTGHGVGYLLSVHEGPQRIHWKIPEKGGCIPLQTGMIVSNEPGVYIENSHGIRHENLMVCDEVDDNSDFLHFVTLTMVPFDRDAIEKTLLSDEELERLNAYHKVVYEKLKPYMMDEEHAWLYEMTKEIVR